MVAVVSVGRVLTVNSHTEHNQRTRLLSFPTIPPHPCPSPSFRQPAFHYMCVVCCQSFHSPGEGRTETREGSGPPMGLDLGISWACHDVQSR